MPLLTVFALLFSFRSVAQDDDTRLIQFSGMVFTDADGRLAPVPYATISIPQKHRGTYSDYRGFFSIVVEKGDKVRFNCIGLEPVTIT
ncbi:MAG: carboxypeptidase-like regulatory domain-containing protein, partial [Bacteroidota bacterium]